MVQSFAPISDSETRILILGTMPGDESLRRMEYYGHPRNKFWKIISAITNTDFPTSYSEKLSLLQKNQIGIWDVAYKANRNGSLDTAIIGEIPNDLDIFLSSHKNIRIIGFNGMKAQSLFDKYFVRRKEIAYFLLPSTSPANTTINFENICKQWQQILINHFGQSNSLIL